MPAPTPIPVAILGVTGYAGEIALRILLNHPHFTVVHAGSDRLGGTMVADAVPSFAGETDLVPVRDPSFINHRTARAYSGAELLGEFFNQLEAVGFT